MKLPLRYRACLLGGAIGDALGAPVEFLDDLELRRRFGPGGIRDYAPAFGRVGAITDDTQMTLFTAEGLLQAAARERSGQAADVPAVVERAYLRWLHTQEAAARGGAPGMPEPAEGWLLRHPELFALRAPGNTCLDALRRLARNDPPGRNGSKGCGGVMRMAPVGLHAHSRYVRDPLRSEMRKAAFSQGCRLAAVTHGHATGQLASGAFALLVLCLLQGEDLGEAVGIVQAELLSHEDYHETFHALSRASRLATSSFPPEVALRELGEGWVAEEALAIAVYCALVARSFEDGVVLAVNHRGDSDSTGSIAGNLLGIIHGLEAIPARWLDPLELRPVIAQVADDLADSPAMGAPGHDDRYG